MSSMFDTDGKLRIPILDKLKDSGSKLETNGKNFIIKEAYCPKGHSLMSKIQVDGRHGIQFFVTDQNKKKKTEIVLSPVIGEHKIINLSDEVFKDGEIVKLHCPTCHTELEVLVNCECGEPMYVFYLDNHLDRNFGVSLCARIGCTKSSRLRFSKEALMEYLKDHIL